MNLSQEKKLNSLFFWKWEKNVDIAMVLCSYKIHKFLIKSYIKFL